MHMIHFLHGFQCLHVLHVIQSTKNFNPTIQGEQRHRILVQQHVPKLAQQFPTAEHGLHPRHASQHRVMQLPQLMTNPHVRIQNNLLHMLVQQEKILHIFPNIPHILPQRGPHPHFTQHIVQSIQGWHLIPQHVKLQFGHQDSFSKTLSPGSTFSDLAR